MSLKVLVIFIVALFITSCAKQFIDQNGNPCKKSDAITILNTIPENCVNLGIVAGYELTGNINDMLESLKNQAAEKCADAVFVPDSFMNGNYHNNMIGQCLKYR